MENKKRQKSEIKVVVTNPKTKEEIKQKEKELCAFLAANWHAKINEKP